MRFFCLLLLSFTIYAAPTINDGWLKLLRYNKTFTGFESEVDNSEFFITKNGKYDPQAELDSYLELIKNSNISKDHIICLFPARAKFIEKNYKVTLPFDIKKCEEVKKLYDKINVEKVSLVFSSYFIEKPASAFGHTFLKVKTKDSTEENDFLDYAVDFSAQVTTKNPILYGILGIFGGFSGKFSLMPYYVKIKEYNDMESRDLWDFELNFSRDDVDFFVYHLFEMNRAKIDYFYFKENCSYHILRLIDAIKPAWNLASKVNYFVPPIDTLHAINDKNVISKVNYRPSKYQSLITRMSQNSKNDKTLIKYEEIVLLANDTAQLNQYLTSKNSSEKIEILDFLNDYIDFKNSEVLSNKDHPDYKNILKSKFALNLERSKIADSDNQSVLHFEDYIKNNSPLLAHKTRRISFFYQNNENQKNQIQLEYRFALHDYLDDKFGHIPFATSELGVLKLSYLEDDKIYFKRFDIVNVEALRDRNQISQKISWKFNFYTEQEINKKDFLQNLDLSLGLSYSPIKNFLWAIFWDFDNTYNFNEKEFVNKTGPSLFVLYNSKLFAIKNNLKYFNDYYQTKDWNYKNEFKLRLHLEKNNQIELSHYYEKNENQFSVGYLLNF